MVDPALAVAAAVATPNFGYFLAGGVCCSVSHAAATPIDVVKTRLQAGQPGGALGVFRDTLAAEGYAGLFGGFGPTAVGYFCQGALKYGLFEFLKHDVDAAGRVLLLVACAAAAETVASSVLTPFEAARIRMVTDETYGASLPAALVRLLREEGVGGLTAKAPVVLAKMVPYTASQLVSFDLLKTSFVASEMPVASATILASVCAGIVASLLSQPGDTILSLTNLETSAACGPAGQSALMVARGVYRSNGFAGFMTGWKPRLVHTSTIVIVQLLIYDTLKQMLL